MDASSFQRCTTQGGVFPTFWTSTRFADASGSSRSMPGGTLPNICMPVSIQDYLIEQAGIDWSEALSTWSWLLPTELTLWLINKFGDLFMVYPDGTVHMLDVGAGTLARIADSRDDFCTKIDESDNAAAWLLIPFANRLVAGGMRLNSGQCYGLVTPPVLGGQYVIENIYQISVASYLCLLGEIHEQLRDLPDGTKVVLKLTDKPT